jgi:hypothetical protein
MELNLYQRMAVKNLDKSRRMAEQYRQKLDDPKTPADMVAWYARQLGELEIHIQRAEEWANVQHTVTPT